MEKKKKKKKKTFDYMGVTDLTFMQLVINGSLRLSLRLDGSMVWDWVCGALQPTPSTPRKKVPVNYSV